MPSYLYKKTVVIPSGGVQTSLDVSGSFFICTSARGNFQVSFDGQQFCDWEKGLARDKAAAPFDKLFFRGASATAQAHTIEFYYGTERVSDSRLVVIDDSQFATIQSKPAPFFIVPILWGAVANTDGETVPGLVECPDDENALSELRSIEWNTRRTTVDNSLRQTCLEISENGGPVLAETLNRVPGRMEFGPRDNYTITGNVIAEKTYLVANNSGASVTAFVYATYWRDPIPLI